MIVDDLADVRTGDKGDDLMIAVLPRSADAYELLVATLGPELVAARFGLAGSDVSRVLLPASQSMVFHIRGLLAGGVTGSNYLDGHGKTMGYHLLNLRLSESAQG